MKPIRITFAIVLFSAWLFGAARYCEGASSQPPNAAPEPPASVSADYAGQTTRAEQKPKPFKPISELTTNIAPSQGALPEDYPMVASPGQPRAFAPCLYTWTASGLYHKPLYFEDVGLERYGHSCCPCLQPIVSGARFFGTVLVVPYEMGLEPPCEDIYTLGYYRPGSCAPYILDPIPLSVRGALFEAGAWVGGVFLFP